MAGKGDRAGGALAFARAEWRARGRSHAALVLLAAVTLGVSLATFCAAARAETSLDRLREATHASDWTVLISSGNPGQGLATVREAPGVISARAMSDLSVRPEGTDLFPLTDLSAFAPRIDDSTADVDTPVVTDGRAPRPDRPDEIALSAQLAADLSVEPGDELRLESMTDEWHDTLLGGEYPGPADGPTITVTVTGIARSPLEFGRHGAVIHLTPAFVERYDGQLGREDSIHVRVEPELLRGLQEETRFLLSGAPSTASPFDIGTTTEDGLSTIATALRLVGAGAAVAGAVTLALSMARASRASEPERTTMRALGWTRRDELRAIGLAYAPALAAGLAVGAVVGVRASPRATVGLARAIDPRPGAVIVSSGLVAAVIAIAVLVAAGLLLAVAARSIRRTSPVTPRVAPIPVRHPLPLVLGVRHALVAPRDHGGRTSRAAIAAVAGSAAVGLAALVVSSSIERLQADPTLTGERPERVIDSGQSWESFETAMEALEPDARVDVLAAQHSMEGSLRGLGHTFILINDPRRGRIDAPVVTGRMPRTADEVALGPDTAEQTGQIGDEVRLASVGGTGTFRVVGTVLFPEGDFTHDEGAAVTVEGAERLIGGLDDQMVIHQVVFDWASDVDTEAADRELKAEGLLLLERGTGFRLTPGTVTNLGEVEQLPRQLAALLVLLGVTTLLHAAWASVAVGARDLVTLRALGFTRRSTEALSAAHAGAIVGVGLLVGTPVGIVIGRLAWRSIAEGAHVVYRPVLTLPWFGVAVGIAVVAGLLVAALAARWTARLPAAALRAE